MQLIIPKKIDHQLIVNDFKYCDFAHESQN